MKSAGQAHEFGLRLVRMAAAWLLALAAVPTPAANIDPALVALHTRSFLEGREYFLLRSGRATLIAQADQVDLGPAFMYLLFDADNNRQSARKQDAFNFADGQGFAASALEVVLGGFPFTAIGHETQTRWTTVDGIPAVEAVWWAGGVRVTEHLLALGDDELFLRRIQLASVNLAGPEDLNLRLALPPGTCALTNGWLARDDAQCRMALGLASVAPARALIERGAIEIGPLPLAPGQTVSIDTMLLAQIPPGQAENWSPLSALSPQASPSPGALDLPAFNIAVLFAKTRQAWAATSSIHTTDTTVQEIFDKARFGLAAMVADRGVMDAGIFEYGSQWVRDSSNTLLGLVHAGQFELARRGFSYLLQQMVNADGNAMMGGGFDDPDHEEFDQMGELLHALKAYRDWTGDDSLLRENRAKLLAMIERPLRPAFRDQSGLVHNRREFWERTFDDAYELAYQNFVILGLQDAAALAEPLGATDRAARWLSEADRTRRAMLQTPGRALVENGRLIKRRDVNGQPVRVIHFNAAADDVPLKTERVNLADPDATTALPIAYGLVPPRSALALNTLDELEKLRDARWFGGGYERYHSSGQCDQPGPWPFATCFILRAQHEAGLFDRGRRTLEWLNTVQGGRSGAWFEEIPLVRSQAPTAGIIPWTSGEISLFIVRHLLGVRFEGQQVILKPALYPGSPPVRADLRFHSGRLLLDIPDAGPIAFAQVNGRRVAPRKDGSIALPADFEGGSVVFHTRKAR
jgi:hypothetical protein